MCLSLKFSSANLAPGGREWRDVSSAPGSLLSHWSPTVDALAARAVARREVATLEHELLQRRKGERLGAAGKARGSQRFPAPG